MVVTRDDVQDPTGQRTNIPGRGYMRGFGTGSQYKTGTNSIGGIIGNPIQGEVGYGPGATFQNPLAVATGNYLWLNIGTALSANWINVDESVVDSPLQSMKLILNSSTVPTAPTAAQTLAADFTTILFSGTTGGATTFTLASTANLIAAVPNPEAGDEFRLRIVNETGSTLTMVAGDGSTTQNGNDSVASAAWRDFDVFFNIVTGTGSITMTNIGAGTV
jgi:hypothetical protein